MQKDDDKALSMLGMAKRANKAVSGAYAVERALQRRQAYLLIVARDASDATKKKLSDAAVHAGVPIVCCGTKEQLGHALGEPLRALAAVTDHKLARAVQERMPVTKEEQSARSDA